MKKLKVGHFYILGRGEKMRFWALTLRMVKADQIIILQYDEIKGEWNETLWGTHSFTLIVEIEKISNTVPVNLMNSLERKITIKAVLERND